MSSLGNMGLKSRASLWLVKQERNDLNACTDDLLDILSIHVPNFLKQCPKCVSQGLANLCVQVPDSGKVQISLLYDLSFV